MATQNIQTDRFKEYSYPENLSTAAEFNGERVLFFIKVATSSQMYNSSNKVDVITVDDDDPLFGKETLTGQRNTKFQQSRPLVQAKAVIALYVPADLSYATSVSWSEEDTSMDILANLNEIAGRVAKEYSAKQSAGDNALIQAGSAAAAGGATGGQIAGSMFLKMAPQSVQKALQVTPGNAKVEQMFQGVDFRTFNFNYQFNPKSQTEAKNVLNIVKMFRHHMLPEFYDKSQYLYIYPSQFDIKYFKGSEEHPYLERHFTQVLTSCTVNYAPTGQHVTFKDGMPAHINLQLQFKELSVHTKETMPL